MSLLKNTRLQTKLIVSFILSSLMTLGVGVFAVFELGKVNNAEVGSLLWTSQRQN